MKPSLTAWVLVFLVSAPTYADEDYYVSVSGSGIQDGSSWANAVSASHLQQLLSERVQPGSTIVLGSGSYRGLPHTNNTLLRITRGGEPGQPVCLHGIDTGGGLPTIVGRWKADNPKYHAHSSNAIAISEGVSHVSIRHIRIENCMQGIRLSGGHSGIHVEDVVIDSCREGLRLVGLSRSTISKCEIIRYTKRGIRFEAGCRELQILDVTADATAGSDSWPTEVFPFGFSIEDDAGNQSIHFERCTARNNRCRGTEDSYWNGDGFVAEAKAVGISYTDCMSFDNTDGGWDDKSLAPVLTGCVALRNKRAFRLWNVRGNSKLPARLKDCLGSYSESAGGIGSAVGLWVCGAVEADHCTFHNNQTAAVAIENNGPGGKLALRDCILSADRTFSSEMLVLQEVNTDYRPTGVVMWHEGPQGAAPDYVKPSKEWNGKPRDAFNSQRYGKDKGYWTKAAGQPGER